MSGLSLRINTWNVGRTHVTLWVFCLIGDDHCRRDHSPGYGFLALSDDTQFCVYHGGLAGPPFPKCLQRSALEALHQPRCHTGPPQRAELRLLPTAWLGGSVVLPPGGHTNHVVSSDLPPTLGCCHVAWRAGPSSRHQFRKHPALPSPYLPLDQNRGGGVWCHRDETWRLSQTCNTRKKKARITWFCLYLAASLEICSHLLQSPRQPCGL